jgi:hypothetical protein
MKKLILLLLLSSPVIVFSQPFSLGCFSGTGFSDIHGKFTSERYSPQAGPVMGVFFGYSLSPVFSVGTEFSYTRQVYSHRSYSTYYPPYWPDYRINSQLTYNYTVKESWNYDFLRVPLYFTLSTPTRLRLSLSAGVYVSFQTRHDFTQRQYYPPVFFDYWNYYYSYEEKVPRHDNGLFYSLRVSYPVSDNFSFYASTRYIVGYKEFMKSDNARTGASEIIMGISYNGLYKKHKKYYSTSSDSLSALSVTIGGGIGISGTARSEFPSHYKTKKSGMISIGIDYKLDETVSMVTGLRFERKGYAFQDSSLSFFRHESTDKPEYSGLMYKTDTRVDLDYAVIPVMFRFSFGNTLKGFVQAGLYAAFNLNDRVTGEAVRVYYTQSHYDRYEVKVYDNIEGEIANSEAGFILGAGITIPLMHLYRFYISADYESGFKSVFETQTNLAPDNYTRLKEYEEELRNRSLDLSFGVIIPVHSIKK